MHNGNWSRRELLGATAAWAAALACDRGASPSVEDWPAGTPVVRWWVDRRRARRRMQGGLGASWHAPAREFDLSRAGLVGWKDARTSRGSGWGGNPPVTWTESWNELERHASWLGLSWLRVEMSQRMYEPEKGRFDWDNEEMRALDRILSWCDRAGAEVLLQQMWSFVDWNRHPGVAALQSGPRDLAAFAEGLASAVEHLVRTRNHHSIRWLDIVNEPNVGIGWWLGPDRRPLPLGPALAAVREALDRRRIDLPLAAPGWNRLHDPPGRQFDWQHDPSVGAFDLHNYSGPRALDQMEKWVGRARRRGIPFFVSEVGDFKLGWKGRNAGPASFAAALSTAAQVLGGVERGVDGFSRWSFTNRGDLDGQWQLVRTWDPDAGLYRHEVEPEPVPYFSFALLTRYWANRSTALATLRHGAKEVSTAALESPGGELTLLVANPLASEVGLELVLEGTAHQANLHRYRVEKSDLDAGAVRLDPRQWLRLAPGRNEGRDRVPPRSLTAYSTFELRHDDPGIVEQRTTAR